MSWTQRIKAYVQIGIFPWLGQWRIAGHAPIILHVDGSSTVPSLQALLLMAGTAKRFRYSSPRWYSSEEVGRAALCGTRADEIDEVQDESGRILRIVNEEGIRVRAVADRLRENGEGLSSLHDYRFQASDPSADVTGGEIVSKVSGQFIDTLLLRPRCVCPYPDSDALKAIIDSFESPETLGRIVKRTALSIQRIQAEAVLQH